MPSRRPPPVFRWLRERVTTLWVSAEGRAWHVRRMDDTATRRPRLARTLTAGTLLALALVGSVTVLALTWYQLSMDCQGYDDEGTIRAPRSPQGRLVCSDGGLGEPRMTLLVAASVVLWVLALVLWRRNHRFACLVPLLVLVVAGPALTAVVATRLPDACRKEQWQEYGNAGCERNLEMRLEGHMSPEPSSTGPRADRST
jgi:hypothetical protein